MQRRVIEDYPFDWEPDSPTEFEPEPLYLPLEQPSDPEERPTEPRPAPSRVIVIPIA